MAESTEAEKQLLIAVLEITRNKGTPDKKAFDKFGKAYFSDDLVDWTEAFGSLTEKGLLQEKDGVYSVSEQGEIYAREVRKEYSVKGFSDWMIRSERCRAYSLYCERVHGKDLCQCNMMDMEQLQTLLDVLDLNGSNQALDMGCGIGLVTEYISDLTRACVTGIDFATGAIKRAQERTTGKRDRLTFQEGDLNDLEFPDNSFDTIVAIDTLYFLDDLEWTVGQMKAILKPEGQMGVFFTQTIKPDDPRDLLLPEKTRLAQALQKHGLSYRTWDFTESEHEHWRNSKKAAEDMKSEFEAEGYLDLCKSRIEESEFILEFVDSGRISRYLYHVR